MKLIWKWKEICLCKSSNFMSSLKQRFPKNHPISTLWESMRLETRSRSPWTGWSSASWGSTRYSQSTSAWRASANWPENKRASSNLCCLRRKTSQIIYFSSFYIQSYSKWVIPVLLTSPHSFHTPCPICHGPRPTNDPVFVCLTAVWPCLSWPSQSALWCHTLAAWSQETSGNPKVQWLKDRGHKRSG